MRITGRLPGCQRDRFGQRSSRHGRWREVLGGRAGPGRDFRDTDLVQVVATSAARVALLCVGNPGLSKATKSVYLSADAGKTDTYAGTMGLFGIAAQLAVSPSGNLAVASWSDGSFIYINDTRKSAWTMTIGYGDGGAGWNDITYLTHTTAWVVYAPVGMFGGFGKLFVTHDGGRHWNVVTP